MAGWTRLAKRFLVCKGLSRHDRNILCGTYSTYQTHESLLDRLISDRGGVVEVQKLAGDLGEEGVLGVLQVVVVEQAGVRLSDELASRGVESHVVKAVERDLLVSGGAVGAVGVAICLTGELLLAGVVGLVTGVNSLGVAADGVVTVDVRVLAGEVRLVEIVDVSHVSATETGLEDDGRIGTDEEGNAASTASRAGISLLVESNVTSDNNRVAAVPSGGLNPVDSVENSVSAAVAGVHGIDTLDVGVAGLSEELHKHRLDGLGLVEQSLGADFEAANVLGIDIVLLDERRDGGEGKRVDVW